MEAEKALRLLARLERTIGELYAHFAKAFESDKEAFELFSQLSLDEKSHESVCAYQLRLVKNEKGGFADVEMDEAEPLKMIAFAEKLMKQPAPGLKQAVDLAIKIEGAASEMHYRTALAQSRPDLTEFIHSLGVSDEAYNRRLVDFVVSRDLS